MTIRNRFIMLNAREHGALTEALRRRTRFFEKDRGIRDQWTGLGGVSEYKFAVNAGLMTRVHQPNPGHSEWWRLTERGARIISYWMGRGLDHEKIEAGNLPPAEIPQEVWF